MSPRSKKEYIEATFLRYKKASRKKKTVILDEFCATCQCHRKHAIRILRGFKRFVKPKAKRRGRKSLYQKESILKPLKKIWRESNFPCSKRLKAILPLWIPGYIQSIAPLSLPVIKSLNKISHATIDRLLKPIRIHYQKRGRSTTKPGTLLRKQIPIKTNQWDEDRPGFIEADTVPIVGTLFQACLSIPWIPPISAPVGPNNGPSGARGKPTPSNRLRTLKFLSLFLSSASIVITAGSSSIITS